MNDRGKIIAAMCNRPGVNEEAVRHFLTGVPNVAPPKEGENMLHRMSRDRRIMDEYDRLREASAKPGLSRASRRAMVDGLRLLLPGGGERP